jgi:hypothetical protein
MTTVINPAMIDSFAPFSDRLKQAFQRMDDAYRKASAYYDFYCSGCEDNCCRTCFHHHTFLEFFYIFKGFEGLSSEKRREIRQKAEFVSSQSLELKRRGETIHLMCPLNEKGLCLLYEYRPMICRLHGISHELHRPDGQILYGDGCDVFMKISEKKENDRFDRTPFYKEIAMLEKELREKIKIFQKVKMTVSQMLIHFP